MSILEFELPRVYNRSVYVSDSKQNQVYKRKLQRKTSYDSKIRQELVKNKKSLSKIQKSLSSNQTKLKQISNRVFMQTTLKQFMYKKGSKQILQKRKLQKKKLFNLQKIQAQRTFPQTKAQLYMNMTFMNDFKISINYLNHICHEGHFPLNRIGATISIFQNQIYLFGGTTDTFQNNLIFHQLKLNQNQWKHVKSQGAKPNLSFNFHSVNTYKDHLVFVGGESLQKVSLKRQSNHLIGFFNILKKTWHSINWHTIIKHHSSVISSNCLIIYGGINQKQCTQNKLHLIFLNSLSLTPKICSLQTNEYLSHHKMITTLNQDSRLRLKFGLDGLIVFGGKRRNQDLTNEILFIKATDLRINDQNIDVQKKWLTFKVQGPKPLPRMSHTFDLIPGKGQCVLIGGINEQNQYLNDVWVFNLLLSTWIEVQELPLLRRTGGIAYHSTVVKDTDIYLYGGLTKNPTNIQFYMISTQKLKRQAIKKSTLSKNQTSHSIKIANQKD